MVAVQEAMRVRISARELAAFSHPDWSGCRTFWSETADGLEQQRRLQEQRPGHYTREVSLSQILQRGGLLVELRGRLDGLYDGPSPILEEIKTTRRRLSDVLEAPDPAHWVQLEVYGYLLCLQRNLSTCTLHLTYVLAPSGVVQVLVRQSPFQELEGLVDGLLEKYLAWHREVRNWRRQRDRELSEHAFPFPRRPGQPEIEALVEEACRTRRLHVLEAPTGVGKTLSALHAGLRQLGSGEIDQLAYACPRSTGRKRAAEAIQVLGLAETCKTVILGGRERVCDGGCCGRIPGPDQLLGLRSEFFRHTLFDTPLLQRLADSWGVCPYRLGMEWARWADLVIADYHYWLGPGGTGMVLSLPRRRCLLLVDEAHQLAERARSFYSASLDLATLQELGLGNPDPVTDPATPQVDYLAAEEGQPWLLGQVPPDPLVRGLQRLYDRAGELAEGEPGALWPELRESYFELGRFLHLAAGAGRGFACWRSGGMQPGLFLDCLDPLPGLSLALEGHHGCVLFSATLQADPVLAGLIDEAGGDWSRLEAIFPESHLQVVCAGGLDTRFRARRRLPGEIGDWIRAFCEAIPGHSILYFPSYRLLRDTFPVLMLDGVFGGREVMIETPGLSDPERGSWLERFRSREPCLGLCVLGGSFAEAIDLPGGLLRGIGIVGPGLPPPSFRRNLIFEYFEESGFSGFERAYRIPGMQRVIQAAGRLIRSAQDRGTLVLFGRRFLEPEYRGLLPRHWSIEEVSSPAGLRRSLQSFWEER